MHVYTAKTEHNVQKQNIQCNDWSVSKTDIKQRQSEARFIIIFACIVYLWETVSMSEQHRWTI